MKERHLAIIAGFLSVSGNEIAKTAYRQQYGGSQRLSLQHRGRFDRANACYLGRALGMDATLVTAIGGDGSSAGANGARQA